MKAYQKIYADLWIDHHKAPVVSITDDSETIFLKMIK
jgi:hypothetical protein